MRIKITCFYHYGGLKVDLREALEKMMPEGIVEAENTDELLKKADIGVVEFKEHEEVMTILSNVPNICGSQVAEETNYERFLCEYPVPVP